MYYLQSRYYNPINCKFLNSDEAYYINLISKQILEYNLYQYCYNNCSTLTDYNGRSPNQTTMGFGLQFEVSGSLFGFIASGCIGLELIWYTSNRVTDARKGIQYPCVYWYYGGGISVSGGNIVDKLINKFSQWLTQAAKNPSKIFSALKVSFGFSVCAFLLKGYTCSKSGRYSYNNYKKFSSYKDYEGNASGRSYTAFHVKAYHAYSDTCDTWGLGYDTNKFGTGYASVKCQCLNSKYIEMPSSITNKIQKKANNAI